MIAQNFDYATPQNLKEALELLSDSGAKVLAGGMSLIPLMKLRLAAPETLVDLRNVADLRGVAEVGGRVRLGALTTHFEVESSPVVRARCPLLGQAASQIGDVQVRNMGTIGGSVAHCDPAADYPAALQALEAEVTIAGGSGQRNVAVSDFFVDTFTTTLEPGELVVAVSVPAEESGTGTRYEKCANPASGYATAGVAVRVRKSGGKVSFARVGVTGLASCSFRARKVEDLLLGTAGSADDVRKAAAAIADGVEPLSDLAAAADYRAHLAKVYAARALAAALGQVE